MDLFAEDRFAREVVLRNPDWIMKKTVVSKHAVLVNEWFESSRPKGWRWSVTREGRLSFHMEETRLLTGEKEEVW